MRDIIININKCLYKMDNKTNGKKTTHFWIVHFTHTKNEYKRYLHFISNSIIKWNQVVNFDKIDNPNISLINFIIKKKIRSITRLLFIIKIQLSICHIKFMWFFLGFIVWAKFALFYRRDKMKLIKKESKNRECQ